MYENFGTWHRRQRLWSLVGPWPIRAPSTYQRSSHFVLTNELEGFVGATAVSCVQVYAGCPLHQKA